MPPEEKSFFEKHPWFGGLISNSVSVALFVAGVFVNLKLDDVRKTVDDTLRDIRAIKESTAKLSKHLEKSLDGGINVTVGVNPKELRENLAFVFSDNPYQLEAGDRITLTNYTDGTFNASITLTIQKPVLRDPFTTAEIFVSEDAAKRLGFVNYARRGTEMFKMSILKKTSKPDNNQ